MNRIKFSFTLIFSFLLAFCQTPEPATSTPSKRIAYCSGEATDLNIHSINIDGSADTQLTYHTAQDIRPLWSPDGESILFQTNRFNSIVYKLYLMNKNGSDPRNITNTVTDLFTESFPAWAPDGTHIAYTSENALGAPKIYLLKTDETEPPFRLTSQADAIYEDQVSWSPDGSRLAFMSIADDNEEIFMVNNDGSNLTRITNHAASDWMPLWSPDGTKLLFLSSRDGGTDLYVTNDTATATTRLTEDGLEKGLASWSPDGTQILYQKMEAAGNSQIYSVPSGGGIPLNLSSNVYNEIEPAWSPDGKKISFTSDREVFSELYTMSVDGSNRKRLTFNALGVQDGCSNWEK